MTVETIQILSTASFILAGALLGTTILLFFVLKIRDAFGFLTGRTKKKAIERIRKSNERSRENVILSGGKDKITSKIITSSLTNNKKYSNDTMLLSQEQGAGKETTLLSQGQNSGKETTLLAENYQSENYNINQSNRIGVTTNLLNLNIDNEKLEIEYEIIFMESTEIIS